MTMWVRSLSPWVCGKSEAVWHRAYLFDVLAAEICMRKLKDPCQTCGRPLDPLWKICPFCEAEIGAVAPQPRRARRRREGTPPAEQQQAAEQPQTT